MKTTRWLALAGAALVVSVAHAQEARREIVEISAPVLPNVLVFEKFHYDTPDRYPATQAERIDLVRDATYSYGYLLTQCAPTHPAITLPPGDGTALTPEQLRTNYQEVARCAYEDFGSKPYWVPQLLLDTDVCALKLGDGWRLPTKEDLERLTSEELRFLRDTLSVAAGSDFPQHFYFSTDLYVTGSDGRLMLGSLDPDAAARVEPLPVDKLRQLYVGNGRPIGVRCLRTRPLVAQ